MLRRPAGVIGRAAKREKPAQSTPARASWMDLRVIRGIWTYVSSEGRRGDARDTVVAVDWAPWRAPRCRRAAVATVAGARAHHRHGVHDGSEQADRRGMAG